MVKELQTLDRGRLVEWRSENRLMNVNAYIACHVTAIGEKVVPYNGILEYRHYISVLLIVQLVNACF